MSQSFTAYCIITSKLEACVSIGSKIKPTQFVFLLILEVRYGNLAIMVYRSIVSHGLAFSNTTAVDVRAGDISTHPMSWSYSRTVKY